MPCSRLHLECKWLMRGCFYKQRAIDSCGTGWQVQSRSLDSLACFGTAVACETLWQRLKVPQLFPDSILEHPEALLVLLHCCL